MKQSYIDLVVWQKSIELVKQIYGLTKAFPADEKYGITQQIRRCAVSIPSNIAEGAARHSNKEFIQFLTIARGSLAELHTQMLICHDIGYLTKSDYDDFVLPMNEVGRMLNGLRNSLTTND